MERTPRVLIGLPVYNGENYLQSALDSFLAQTFTDFRLIISDNASTDSTADIGRKYAERDSRIVYYRQSRNIGAGANHDFVFQPNGASYFKWAGHDDLVAPDYLLRCVELLDCDPSIVCAQSKSLWINQDGNVTGTFDHEFSLNGEQVRDRFWGVLWGETFSPLYGVIRSDVMAKTKLHGNFAGSDRNFVAELLLHAKAGFVDDYLFYCRKHPDSYSCSLKDNKTRMLWYNPKTKTPDSMLGFLKFKNYLEAIIRSPISFRDRFACIQVLAEWGFMRGIESSIGIGESYRQKLLVQHIISGNK